MKHRFLMLVNGELKEYENYEDIPKVIDNVIEFLHYVSPGPHTPEQHKEIHLWVDRFKEVMKRETK